jgi:hypothetical protein
MSTENALRNKLQTSTNNSSCGKNKKNKKNPAPSIYPNPICQPKQASQATNGGV